MDNIQIRKYTRPFHRNVILFLFTVMSPSIVSCEDFLEVDVAKSQITKDLVFTDELTASSALAAIYSTMYSDATAFGNGSQYSISSLSALSADEMKYFPDNITWNEFENNTLSPDNGNVMSLWKSLYQTIYMANSAIEGLEGSSELIDSVADQLTGEALFVRAFAHFYLINLFGDIPLVMSTDYTSNSKIARSPVGIVYQQVIADLLRAQSLMGVNYATNGRARPNKAVATAMLARVYLYTGSWAQAEVEATKIISDPMYILESDLSKVFLATSREALWQLVPPGITKNTNEGSLLILTGPPSSFLRPFELTTELISSFEVGDIRKTDWVKSITSAGSTYYYPFKYRIANGLPLKEYSMVFRLAEQYLIRAEARTQQNNLEGAIYDLDALRKRAGLSLIADTNPDISQESLLLAVAHERETELFTEWGHRWFDLKRTGRADVVLASKANWSTYGQLYPIPQSELDKNNHLGTQNSGY